MAIDDYDILRFDPVNGTMDVYFRSVDFKWSINVPIDGTAEDEATLDGYIRGFFPRDMHERQQNRLSEKCVSLISSKVAVETDEQRAQRMVNETIGRVYHLLRQTDWTQLLDSNLTSEEVEAWADYRNELRNLLNGINSHDTIDWPVMPNEELREIKVNVS